MKLLILSDSHSNIDALTQAINSEPDASVVIHLGDGEADIKKVKAKFPKKEFIQVKGNCDFGSQLPLVAEYSICGKRIMATHGHIFNVKSQLSSIYFAAKDKNADILLFGHTHVPFITQEDNLHIMNPGSLYSKTPSYGIINIENDKIYMKTINLKVNSDKE